MARIRNAVSEDTWEDAVVSLFEGLGYRHIYGPTLKDRNFHSPLYDEELDVALHRINPDLPDAAINEALFKLKNFENAELIQKNALFMDYLQNGVTVRYTEDKEIKNTIVYLVNYDEVESNSFIVANQWSFVENSKKRPDILLFINGFPLALIELKSPKREESGASEAYRQIKNYQKEIPSMFIYNAVCAMSDLLISKVGTITSDETRFVEWKTVDGCYENTKHAQFNTFFSGIFQKKRFLDILKNFICFSDGNRGKTKILAAYHQYFAVKKAIESTKKAVESDGKGGVFWHTQGSGKSLSMVFYAHLLQKALNSPTIVVLTDRNDLDNQLYRQFSSCREFLRQEPIQATCRKLTKTSTDNDVGLKNWLDGRQANGIIFTTMQKFEETEEPLSLRRNIIVMADEAHRGQYGLSEKIDCNTGIIKCGMARVIRNALPNATYIGFTGTPISLKDRDTREVFGDYVDIYDMTQAVEDGATRPVYYESRVIKLKLDDTALRLIDNEYDILSNNADSVVIEKSKRQLGQMEAILGNENTINSLVSDILEHYEKYRANLLTGKAMIVAYSRAIAIKIYRRILELRPSWSDKIAVVMTSDNNDPEDWREIIGNKSYKEELARKFKDDENSLKIAIVVDMWLTGFDVQSLATMYIYKPMIGHNLMQAIARVNRVFRDKEGGLIIDYVGIARALKQAMKDYSRRDRENYKNMDISRTALPKFEEKLQICRDLLHGYDYHNFATTNNLNRAELISGAVNFIVTPKKTKQKEEFLEQALFLRQSSSLCSSIISEDLRIEAAFMEAVRILILKLVDTGSGEQISLPEINNRINEFLKQSIQSEGVINLFADIQEEFSLFNPKFLNDISKIKGKSLAVELLKKLISEQIQIYRRTNIVKAKKFSKIMEEKVKRYLNGMLTNEQVIEELLILAKQMIFDKQEARDLGLSADEVAFYDALTKPKAIKEFYTNETLITITKELAETLRKNKTIDWQKRDPERAKMRILVKRLLKKYKYPPENQDNAAETVIEQCEVGADNAEI